MIEHNFSFFPCRYNVSTLENLKNYVSNSNYFLSTFLFPNAYNLELKQYKSVFLFQYNVELKQHKSAFLFPNGYNVGLKKHKSVLLFPKCIQCWIGTTEKHFRLGAMAIASFNFFKVLLVLPCDLIDFPFPWHGCYFKVIQSVDKNSNTSWIIVGLYIGSYVH